MARLAGLVRRAAIGLFAIAYILLAHHTNSTPGMENLGTVVALAPIVFALLSFAWHAPQRVALFGVLAVAAMLLALRWHAFSAHYGQIYWLEHAGTELALGIAFARTLRPGQVPMCTSFARMVHGTLGPELERYTRQVTLAWVVFFGGMATVSTLVFLAAPLRIWSLFANFFTAPLIGAMFVGEYAVRRRMLPDLEHAHIVDGMKAFWKSSAG